MNPGQAFYGILWHSDPIQWLEVSGSGKRNLLDGTEFINPISAGNRDQGQRTQEPEVSKIEAEGRR
jgi:hypothetical protein